MPDVIREKVQGISEFEIKVVTTILTDEQGTNTADQTKDIEALVYTVLVYLKSALQYKRALGKDVLSLVQAQFNREWDEILVILQKEKRRKPASLRMSAFHF
ncbi:hypothetical protein [Paenibacillus sp. WC2504]|uniref:hypothetical protein n=1 Tax=Paenibacillus sp. WC2504 TaxID=3461403 RepID=UPI0040460268